MIIRPNEKYENYDENRVLTHFAFAEESTFIVKHNLRWDFKKINFLSLGTKFSFNVNITKVRTFDIHGFDTCKRKS